MTQIPVVAWPWSRAATARAAVTVLSAAVLAFSMVIVQPHAAAAQVPSADETKIKTLLVAQEGKKGCVSGVATYKFFGSDSCHAWCAIFAGWVWYNADNRIDIAGLSALAASFDSYGTNHKTRNLATIRPGDAIVFDDGTSKIIHVGIVYSVDTANHKVTYYGGNGTVGSDGKACGSCVYHATIPSGIGTWAYGMRVHSYNEPVLKAPTNVDATISDGGGWASVSWVLTAYNPETFKIKDGSTTVLTTANGTPRQAYVWLPYGKHNLTVCATVGGVDSCSSPPFLFIN